MKFSRSRLVPFALAACGLFTAGPALAGNPAVPYVMAGGDYTEGYADIANWTNLFAAGIGAGPYGVTATPALSQNTVFSINTASGVQKGALNIQILATGATDNSDQAGFDLYLNFANRNAGTVSLKWAAVANSTGDRKSCWLTATASARFPSTPRG